ncbi:hypothetical protein QR680_012255 [Steinernema hermaphroditum]|uniref:Uncharacterized protein n=1 Tax=Steinernema hermaphroditum TaxID=289476 RepID=A0AA39I3E1_9BILA|nr:hypothetical protein QR680_012237 [Steinernema hermaphroditum]KAK0416024.1 hypothetical protein QR680_012255 [Steinernema hermaphroditum]
MSAATKTPLPSTAPGFLFDALSRKALRTARTFNGTSRVDVELSLRFDGGVATVRNFRIEWKESVKGSKKKLKEPKNPKSLSETTVTLSESDPDILSLGGLLNGDCCVGGCPSKTERKEPDIVSLRGFRGSECDKSKNSQKEEKKFADLDIVTFDGLRHVDKGYKPERGVQRKKSESDFDPESENGPTTSDLFPQATIQYVRQKK